MNRFIAALLRIALSSLPVALGHPALAGADTLGIAAVSAANMVAVPITAAHAVAAAPRGTLDLRPPDLRSLHIQNLQPVAASSDSDEAAEDVTIAAAPLLLPDRPDTHPSLAGIASLYWAARHPPQAWRVLLPIQLDGYEATADMRASCAAVAGAQSGPVTCP